VTISNELIVNLKSGDIITTGNNYILDIPSTLLRVKNINNDYSIVDRNKYTRGWLIGNFEPSILKISDFELGILSHKKNEKWPFHYHKYCREINILLKGRMIINNISINTGDVFIFDNNVISCPLFLDDCIVICIKIPSIPNDKEII
jgi:mannose-6-phosphate isomerase-like protein (cupin superfamily)